MRFESEKKERVERFYGWREKEKELQIKASSDRRRINRRNIFTLLVNVFDRPRFFMELRCLSHHHVCLTFLSGCTKIHYMSTPSVKLMIDRLVCVKLILQPYMVVLHSFSILSSSLVSQLMGYVEDWFQQLQIQAITSRSKRPSLFAGLDHWTGLLD